MAVGITQPGIAGTTTFFEDDANADANLDADNATYSLVDIITKGLASADVTDLATFTKYYRSKCSLQNGDGTGSAVTTFKAKNLALSFDTSKTYLVSATGQANRWTRWGEKVQGAAGNPSGKNGVVMDFAASTIIRGNQLIYASKIKQWGAGFLQFLPGATGLTAEMVDTLLESVTGSITVGNPTGPFQLIYNVDITLGGTGVVSNLVGDFCKRVSIAVTGSNPHHINTNSPFASRDIVFAGTPTIADVRSSGAAALIDPVYSGNAPSHFQLGSLGEWFSFGVITGNRDTGVIIPFVPVSIYNVFGNLVMSGVTDVFGAISFGSGVYQNSLLVRTGAGSPVTYLDEWPFTVVVNQGPYSLMNYYGYTYKIPWPYTDLPSGYGRQYLPFLEEIWLTNRNPIVTVDQIPAAAPNVERNILPLPQEV